MEESGLPRSSVLRNQSVRGTGSLPEVDEALTLSPLTDRRTLSQSTPRRDHIMSSEPLTTTAAASTTDVPAAAASAEKGLLIAVLLMVLLGVTAMLFMN
jgi:hypothetical protein